MKANKHITPGFVERVLNKFKDLEKKIEECFRSVSKGKELLATTITDKGVDTVATDTFETMADNITNIKTGEPTYEEYYPVPDAYDLDFQFVEWQPYTE